MSNTSWSVAEARNNLAEIVNGVAYSGEEVTIEKHGKPMVKIVPVNKRTISDDALREFSGMWKDKPEVDKIGRKSRYFRGRTINL